MAIIANQPPVVSSPAGQPHKPVSCFNIGGLLAVRAWPEANVRRYPPYSGGHLTTRLELIDPLDFEDLGFQDMSAGFEEPQAETEQGRYYKPKLVLVVPRDAPDLAAIVERLAASRWLVGYQDANGASKLVGTRERPLRFVADLETGKKAGDRNSYALTFSGENPARAPFYMAQQRYPADWGRAFSHDFSPGLQ